jgi:ABC-type hemin transport system ATPase subunit
MLQDVCFELRGIPILDRGRVLARGTRQQTLKGETISRLFGHRCQLTFKGGRYSLHFH